MREDWLDAIALLEPEIESVGAARGGVPFYLASESLATAWLEVGNATQALHVLERAAHGKPSYDQFGGIYGAHVWFGVRARLAREYRKLGRVDEAVAIEDDVLHMLKYADADHPIVLQIRKTRAGAAAS